MAGAAGAAAGGGARGEGAAAAAPGRIHFPNKQPELTAAAPRMRTAAEGRQLRRHAAARAPRPPRPSYPRACAQSAERGATRLRGKGDARSPSPARRPLRIRPLGGAAPGGRACAEGGAV